MIKIKGLLVHEPGCIKFWCVRADVNLLVGLTQSCIWGVGLELPEWNGIIAPKALSKGALKQRIESGLRAQMSDSFPSPSLPKRGREMQNFSSPWWVIETQTYIFQSKPHDLERSLSACFLPMKLGHKNPHFSVLWASAGGQEWYVERPSGR